MRFQEECDALAEELHFSAEKKQKLREELDLIRARYGFLRQDTRRPAPSVIDKRLIQLRKHVDALARLFDPNTSAYLIDALVESGDKLYVELAKNPAQEKLRELGFTEPREPYAGEGSYVPIRRWVEMLQVIAETSARATGSLQGDRSVFIPVERIICGVELPRLYEQLTGLPVTFPVRGRIEVEQGGARFILKCMRIMFNKHITASTARAHFRQAKPLRQLLGVTAKRPSKSTAG